MSEPFRDYCEKDFPTKRSLVANTTDNDEMIHPFQNRERFQVQKVMGIQMSVVTYDHETEG